MKLHVFHDSHGFFLNLAVTRIAQSTGETKHLFINLDKKTIYRNQQVTYLKKTISSYRHAVKDLPRLMSVTFYPFDFMAAHFLKALKEVQPDVRVEWVFWGYEYYHRPEFYLSNLDNFSTAYYKSKRSIPRIIRDGLARRLKQALGIPVYRKELLEEGYRSVSRLFSFLEEDFNNVFNNREGSHARWHPISFLSIEAMAGGLERDTRTGESIMIGHAATPSDNHAEILNSLASLRIRRPLFIPLEYGQDAYRKEVKRLGDHLFKDQIEYLEKRLAMDEYYRRLSTIGYAIFNVKWQEGLGNIVFLVWNGTKVFLKTNSSVSQQLKAWGCIIYSIENDLNVHQLSTELSASERFTNRTIVENLISAKKVDEYWSNLLTNDL